MDNSYRNIKHSFLHRAYLFFIVTSRTNESCFILTINHIYLVNIPIPPLLYVLHKKIKKWKARPLSLLNLVFYIGEMF